MNIRFFIHNRETASGHRLIFADYRHSKRWRFSTGITVHEKHWNEKKQRAKPGSPHARNINAVLDAIESRVLEIAYGLIANKRSPLPEAVRKEYESQSSSGSEFWPTWDRFMTEYAAELATQTRKHYRSTARVLEAFENESGNELTFDDMTEARLSAFRSWLRENDRGENTIAGRIKNIKTFLRWVDRNGIAVLPPGWDAAKIGYQKKSERLSMTEDELQAIESTEYDDRLQRVADLFLFHCETGLRYADGQKIQPQNIVGDVLVFRNQKSNKDQKRKLSGRALRIVELYDGELPRISNQKYNQYMKEVAELAGINRGVLHRGEMIPAYQAITTHTARHTFATRLLKAGVPINTVSRMLGHSSVSTTSIYDQTGIEEEFDAIDRAL